MAGTLTKLAGADLATAVERATLSPEAMAPLAGCPDVETALDLLENSGFAAEAVRLLAHALPKRERVWWACMCAANTAPPDLGETERMARETAETWVRQQKEEQRYNAFTHAQSTDFQSPEAWAAVSAFWSGESISLKDLPAVPPPPHASGAAAAGGVALAAVRGDIARYPARLKRFLESGRNIAAGGPGRMPPEEP